MTSDLVLKILMSVTSVIISLIGLYVIPSVKAGRYQKEYELFMDFVESMVCAANQLFTPEEWREKKGYVLKLVTAYLDKHTDLDFNEDQINAFIEGVVREIKAMEGRL